MDKKEARITCSGCGTSYKLKIPVTEKPVSFKCKKCGKVLKIRIAATAGQAPSPPTAAPPAPAPDPEMAPTFDDVPLFETTQLPDTGYSSPGSTSESDFHDQIQGLEDHVFSQSTERPPPSREDGPVRRWIVLSGDMVKGPFSDDEIVSMIKDGDVVADTSLRRGERPWVKACEIAVFRRYFPRGSLQSAGPLASMKLLDEPAGKKGETKLGPRPFLSSVGALLPYPVSGGNWQSLAIFLGIAFVLSSVLSLEFWVGLPLNLLGWTLLYGYLAGLMHDSGRSADGAPPPWNFSQAKTMITEGVGVLAVLLVYCMVPTVILLLLMIASFLNSMTGLGYVFMALTVLAFAGSLFVAPAALVILEKSGKLGTALNPGRIMEIVKIGGQPYLVLSAFSIAAGLSVMLVTILAVFLGDIPDAGFLVAGFVMALALSYGHFVWFHVIGRFSGENAKLTTQVLAKTAS
jgi:hypothetical protein